MMRRAAANGGVAIAANLYEYASAAACATTPLGNARQYYGAGALTSGEEEDDASRPGQAGRQVVSPNPTRETDSFVRLWRATGWVWLRVCARRFEWNRRDGR